MHTSNTIPTYQIVLALLVLFLFHAFNNCIVTEQSTLPQYSDSANLFVTSLNFFRIFNSLATGSISFPDAYLEFNHYVDRTPLLPASAALLYFLFGISEHVALYTNLLYLLLMLVAVYLLGNYLFKDRFTAFFAVFILSMYPIMFGMSRVFIRDYSAVAMVAVCTYMLLAGQKRGWLYALVTGMLIGACLLNRVTNILYLLVPLYCYISGVVKTLKQPLARMVFLCVGFSLLWFLYFPIGFLHYWNVQRPIALGFSYNGMHIMSLASLVYYGRVLIHDQLYLFFSTLLLVSFIILICTRSIHKITFCVFLIVVPWIGFLLIASKQIRFTMPLLAYVAMITACGINAIRSNGIRNVSVWIISIVAVAQVVFITYVPAAAEYYPNVKELRQGSQPALHVGQLAPIQNSLRSDIVHVVDTYLSYDHVRVGLPVTDGYVSYGIQSQLRLREVREGSPKQFHVAFFYKDTISDMPDVVSTLDYLIACEPLNELTVGERLSDIVTLVEHILPKEFYAMYPEIYVYKVNDRENKDLENSLSEQATYVEKTK